MVVGVVILETGCAGKPSSLPSHKSEVAEERKTETLPQNPAPASSPSESNGDVLFTRWAASQLTANNAELVSITDKRAWPFASQPNTSIVLGLAKRDADAELAKYGTPFEYFPFVLLIQMTEESASPKLLGIALRTDLFMGDPRNRYADRHPKGIDVGPFQIKHDEYAFGITVVEGSLGNKSGILFDLMGLYRYQNGELREIYRDAVWVFSKYSEPDSRSCNVELEVSTQPSNESEFYLIRRKYKSSYVEDWRGTKPVDSCALTSVFRQDYTQSWIPQKEMYLDHDGLFLSENDLGTGRFPR